MSDAVLIRGGTVLSQDPAIGRLPRGDVLIVGDRIAAVAPRIEHDGAVVIDGTNRIVLPGLVNAHLHTWQTALRGIAANWTLPEYFAWTHRGLAAAFQPDDLYIATLAGALAQLDAGVTTLVDWCHNNPTPSHTDGAIAGLVESGIRGRFFHGSPKPDPLPGQPHFSEIPQPRSEIERLLTGALAPGGRTTLGLAVLGPHYSTNAVAVTDLRLAEEFGLVASMHQGGGAAVAPGGWEALEREQLLSDRVNVVHGNDLDDDRLRRLIDAGVTFTVAPEGELTQGHGFPITGRVLDLGGNVSLGTDVESVVASDLFVSARVALGTQRGLDNAERRRVDGSIPPTSTRTTQQALDWITIEGARAAGLAETVGSLTPGKQADLIMIRSDDLNVWPAKDQVNAVVMQANPSNVDLVMVAGTVVKRDGRLVGVDLARVKDLLASSADRILQSFGWSADAQSPRPS